MSDAPAPLVHQLTFEIDEIGDGNGPITLLAMIRLHADTFYSIGKILGGLEEIAKRLRSSDKPMPSEVNVWLKRQLGAARTHLEMALLRLPVMSLDRFLAKLEDPKVSHESILSCSEDLSSRIADALSATLVYQISPERTRYMKAELFGPEVAARFPSAQTDIEDAGKCLAFQRGTACVFHLMRVMEAALKVVARPLGIPYAPSWESYISQITRKIDEKHRHKGVQWKKDEPFFKELLGDFHGVKIGWRNPTMHIVRRYEPEEAEEILIAVRGFMRRLAKKYGEPGA